MEWLFVGAAALNLYAAALVCARWAVYRRPLYRPMLWNIVLSILPVLVLAGGLAAWLAASTLAGQLAIPVLILMLGAWLLLLPNASYLITELNLSHRSEDETHVPLWYDIILVITLAMSGVVNTVLNVLLAHLTYAIIVADDWRALVSPTVIIAVIGVMLLVGFGMYLGRYLRVNSWDVKHPLHFARKVVTHFREPVHAWAGIGFTITYALFLTCIYVVVAGPVISMLMRSAGATP